MNKPFTNAFIEFVNAQDPNKTIDHSLWRTCAVGQFADSLGMPITAALDNPVLQSLYRENGTRNTWTATLRGVPTTNYTTMMDMLNCRRGAFNTYGELALKIARGQFREFEVDKTPA